MEKVFKTVFNSNQDFKVKLHKTSTVLENKININNTKPEDVYYDEVIIYDGGGVEGYGY
jgi:hypothetical protein